MGTLPGWDLINHRRFPPRPRTGSRRACLKCGQLQNKGSEGPCGRPQASNFFHYSSSLQCMCLLMSNMGTLFNSVVSQQLYLPTKDIRNDGDRVGLNVDNCRTGRGKYPCRRPWASNSFVLFQSSLGDLPPCRSKCPTTPLFSMLCLFLEFPVSVLLLHHLF